MTITYYLSQLEMGILKKKKYELVEMKLRTGKYRVIFRGKRLDSQGYEEDFRRIYFICNGIKQRVNRKAF